MKPGGEQSDPALVARKRANQGASGPAESVERRAGAKEECATQAHGGEVMT